MLETQTMNLDFIRTFVVSGQSKTMKEASQKLNLDVTNVKRHIVQLEDKMGCKLVKINNGQIELTQDGKEIFEGFEKAYNTILFTEKNYKQKVSINTGKISIGKLNDIDNELINPQIRSFREKYPNISFKIVNLTSEELYEQLSQLSLDFVIDEEGYSNKKSIIFQKKDLYEEKYCICYSKKSFDKINDIKDLINKPLILPDNTKKDREYFDTILKKNDIKKSATIECPDFESALNYAKDGLGFALIPVRLKNGTDKLNYFDIDLNKKIVVSYIDENLSPASREFLQEYSDKK